MWKDNDVLFRLLSESADHAEEYGLSVDLQRLTENGALRACLPEAAGGKNWAIPQTEEQTHQVYEFLRRLGGANLSLARLFEGHLNALRLVSLYAQEPLKMRIFNQVKDGALLGVWGADYRPPLRYHKQSSGFIKLSGAKRFASGLGLVNFAVVSLRERDGDPDQLAIIDVNDSERQNVTDWDVSGMRPTLSGIYDFSDVIMSESDFLGKPGDFQIEPHFQGGIWRYSIAHIGAAERIIAEWQTILAQRNRLDDAFQLARLAKATSSTLAAAAMLLNAARRVDSAARNPVDTAVDDAVLAALLARDKTEETCIEVLQLCEKSLGMEAFMERCPIERMRRDLTVFIRQAAPDGKLLHAAKLLIKRGGQPLW
ncbi:acyl-CoA dehydrogenase family protein [Bartonella sp. LJL80]